MNLYWSTIVLFDSITHIGGTTKLIAMWYLSSNFKYNSSSKRFNITIVAVKPKPNNDNRQPYAWNNGKNINWLLFDKRTYKLLDLKQIRENILLRLKFLWNNHCYYFSKKFEFNPNFTN